MDARSYRSLVTGDVIISHALGLWIAGVAGTIGSGAGFSLSGGVFGLFLGGIFSIPWIAVLALAIWFGGNWINSHPAAFVLIGPILMCGSYALVGGAFLDAVVVSCVASSFFYILLVSWRHFRTRADRVSTSATLPQ